MIVSDGQWVTILLVAQFELALVVSTPQFVRLGGARKVGSADLGRSASGTSFGSPARA